MKKSNAYSKNSGGVKKANSGLSKKSSTGGGDKIVVALQKKSSSTDETAIQVDNHVPNKHLFEVVVESGKVYSIYLMKSELKANNNKFYIVQVLKKKGTTEYYHFVRYGRVGVDGVKTFEPNNLPAAIKFFDKQVK